MSKHDQNRLDASAPVCCGSCIGTTVTFTVQESCIVFYWMHIQGFVQICVSLYVARYGNCSWVCATGMLGIVYVCTMYRVLFLCVFISLGCFCPMVFFSNNGLDWLPWTSFISDLHSKRTIRCKLRNWFSLWCLVSWMNHLPSACWSTARFTDLNDSRCVQWRGIFNDRICLNLCLFMHMITNFSHYFPIMWQFKQNALYCSLDFSHWTGY